MSDEPPRAASRSARERARGSGSARSSSAREAHPFRRGRQGRYLGVLAVVAFVLAVILAFVHGPGGVAGIPPGQRLAPFAVPLATGSRTGEANVARHAHEGAAGNVPACSVRKVGVLNVCALYERGPVVLALFVDESSCPHVLSQMQALAPQFPGVQFAGVAIEGSASEFSSVRRSLRTLVREQRLTLPVGIDADGVLAALYKVVSCPQVSFAYPGGTVQSKALLVAPSTATLRARVAELVAASKARGWRQPASL